MAPIADWRSSTESPPGAPRRVVVGRIRGAHGLVGQLRVQHFTDGPEELRQLTRVSVGASEEDAAAREYEVRSAVPGRPGEVRMALVGIDGRDAAEELQGQLIMADPADLEAPAPGEYWGFQLVGCRVETREGRAIGTVREIWSTGAQELLVVVGEGGREQLIPAVEALLPEVDVEARRIVVDDPPGLLDET